MDEKEYHRHCAELFATIEALLDRAGADFDNNGSIIEVDLEDATLIINKQTPMREVWLAAPEGGRHFVLREGSWRDTRDDAELLDLLRARFDCE